MSNIKISDTSLVPEGSMECPVCRGHGATPRATTCNCCKGEGHITLERKALLDRVSTDIRNRYAAKYGVSLDSVFPEFIGTPQDKLNPLTQAFDEVANQETK